MTILFTQYRQLKKGVACFVSVLFFLTMISKSYAQEPADNPSPQLEQYTQAKMAVDYEGNIAYFAQLLAEKLKLGYYSYHSIADQQIHIQQDKQTTIAELLDRINRQLTNQHLRLEQHQQQIYLVLSANNVSLEMAFVPQKTTFLGEVNFSDKTKNSTEISQINLDKNLKPKELTEEERKQRAIQIESIVTQSQDAKLIAQYAKRKQPIYHIENKKEIKLDSIKSTKISTFLVFQQGVDTNQYEFDGRFQEIVKLDNLVAILHRQEAAPALITVITPEGKKTFIRKTN